MLERVSTDRAAWEGYARATYLAHAKVVPPNKFRFLQYVQAGQAGWWREHAHLGAVLLGSHANAAIEDYPAQEAKGQPDNAPSFPRRNTLL